MGCFKAGVDIYLRMFMENKIYLGKQYLISLVIGAFMIIVPICIVGIIRAIDGNIQTLWLAMLFIVFSLCGIFGIVIFDRKISLGYLIVNDEGMRYTIWKKTVKEIKWSEVSKIQLVQNSSSHSFLTGSTGTFYLVFIRKEVFGDLKSNIENNFCIAEPNLAKKGAIRRDKRMYALLIPHLEKFQSYKDNKQNIDTFLTQKN